MNINDIVVFFMTYPYITIAEIISSYIALGMLYIILRAWSQRSLKVWMILFLICDMAMAFLLLLPWSNVSLLIYIIGVISWIIAFILMSLRPN